MSLDDALLGTPRASGMGESGPAIESGETRGRLENQVGTLLPTPVVTDSAGARNSTSRSADDPRKGANGDTLTDALCPRPGDLPNTREARQQLPTPRATRGGSATETVALLEDVPLLPTPNPLHAGNSEEPDDDDDEPDVDLDEVVALIPTPTTQDGANNGGPSQLERNTPPLNAAVTMPDFGAFTPAIRRWERVLGRPAPSPTEPNTKGNPRLAPAFVEWLMGLEPGHVTAAPVTRSAQLKALGNGVVPQQAGEAFRRILARNPAALAAIGVTE